MRGQPMRFHITAIIAAFWLALPVATNAQWNRPIPQDPERQENRRQEKLSWNRATLGGAYEKVGKKNPRWDETARECLDAAARYFSGDIEQFASLLDVHNGARQAI